MSKKPFYKGQLPESEEEILQYFRINSVADLAAMLCQIPEEDVWELVRDSLISIRSRVAPASAESPYARAIDYLYTLLRFVEVAKRFPTKKEQGKLFEELGSELISDDQLVVRMVTLLRQASEHPKSREAIRQLRESSREIRKGGQEFPDAPDRYEGGVKE